MRSPTRLISWRHRSDSIMEVQPKERCVPCLKLNWLERAGTGQTCQANTRGWQARLPVLLCVYIATPSHLIYIEGANCNWVWGLGRGLVSWSAGWFQLLRHDTCELLHTAAPDL
jgi:hypothetical protein